MKIADHMKHHHGYTNEPDEKHWAHMNDKQLKEVHNWAHAHEKDVRHRHIGATTSDDFGHTRLN